MSFETMSLCCSVENWRGFSRKGFVTPSPLTYSVMDREKPMYFVGVDSDAGFDGDESVVLTLFEGRVDHRDVD